MKRKNALSTRVTTTPLIEALESRYAPAYVGALTGTAATFTDDGGSDTLVITAVNGLLSHNRFAAGDTGFASAFDFDSTTAGVQTLAADAGSALAIDLGTGTDTVIFGGDHHAAKLKASFTVTNADANGDLLEINDSAGTAPVTLNMNSTTIAGSGVNVTTAGAALGTVAIRTGAGADVITIGTASALLNVIDVGAGNDTVVAGGAVQQTLQINGGDGNDALTGGGVADEIHGGAGNDRIFGGRGNDKMFGEAGLDSFVWNPGDGSDTLDGGTGTDQMVFNGANIAEKFTLSAQGTHLHFTRDVALITMDTTRVEQVDLTTLGGADTVTISDLSTTAVKAIRIHSAGSSGDPDGVFDSLVLNGSDRDDHLRADATGSVVKATGLGPVISLTGFDTTDQITLDGGLGQDNVFASSAVFGKLAVATIGETNSNTHAAGTFATPATYDAGSSPSSIASGNLFGMGGVVSNDLVIADGKDDSILILPNAGDGTLLSAIEMSTGGKGSHSVVIEDFNHDSLPDLAVTNGGSGTVSVFLNQGDGTFGAPVLFGTTKNPGTLRVGDVTGDGELDLVMTSGGNTVSILPGHGDGTFDAAIKLATGGAGPADLVLGDFSGTGRLDIAVANNGSDNVAVLHSNADFSFAKAVTTHVGTKPNALAVGDFDGDGSADLAVAHGGSRYVSLLLNGDPGDGTFSSQVKLTHKGANAPGAIAAGDIDGDGRDDLAVGNTGSGTVSVFLNAGNATFRRAFNLDLDDTPARRIADVIFADLNGDGLVDLVTANAGSGDVSVVTRIGV